MILGAILKSAERTQNLVKIG